MYPEVITLQDLTSHFVMKHFNQFSVDMVNYNDSRFVSDFFKQFTQQFTDVFTNLHLFSQAAREKDKFKQLKP